MEARNTNQKRKVGLFTGSHYDRFTYRPDRNLCSMIQSINGVKIKPITSRNPQATSILERIHQTIGSIIQIRNGT